MAGKRLKHLTANEFVEKAIEQYKRRPVGADRECFLNKAYIRYIYMQRIEWCIETGNLIGVIDTSTAYNLYNRK